VNTKEFEKKLKELKIIENHLDYYGKFRWSSLQIKQKHNASYFRGHSNLYDSEQAPVIMAWLLRLEKRCHTSPSADVSIMCAIFQPSASFQLEGCSRSG
jgi:hypothetical protein